jgi:hypothetical protein
MNTEDFFVKLNLDFSDIKLDESKFNFTKSYLDNTFIEYQVEDAVVNYIKSKFPDFFQSWISNVRLTFISASTPPHKDFGSYVSINYYLVTGNGPTIFWTANSDAHQYTENVYQFKDLTEKCSFVATTNSSYLLNVGEVHTVDVEKNSVRKIIRLVFKPNVSYNMVLDKLTELNLIEKTK